jgi:putative lumazine-binding protein
VTEHTGGETPDADVEAVAAVVTEYVQAWFAGDGDRIRVVLHPELAKRRAEAPGAASLDLHEDPVDALVADTASGEGTVFDPVQEVTVLDVHRDIATAMLTCEPFREYVHLARFDDRWLIVNTLYQILTDQANIA